MPHPTPERPKNHEVENEDAKTARREGRAPRPASEPSGSEGSARNSKTLTDPATGEQH